MPGDYLCLTVSVHCYIEQYGTTADKAVFDIALLIDGTIDQQFNHFATIGTFYVG
tara:strand:+ start:6404 stop:6568 length:165 start_codon:yes stop_codon:yes gene_type:complete